MANAKVEKERQQAHFCTTSDSVEDMQGRGIWPVHGLLQLRVTVLTVFLQWADDNKWQIFQINSGN